MKQKLWNCLQEETGNFTLEAALIVPIVISLICVLLLGNILTFRKACGELAALKEENASIVRKPGEVIRNTDLGLEYLKRLQQALEGET